MDTGLTFNGSRAMHRGRPRESDDMSRFTRRETLIGAGALASTALWRPRLSFGQGWNLPIDDSAQPPDLPIEDGATLRVVRPSKFVDGDQKLWEQNTQSFTDKTGVPVKIEYEAWEDLRPKTAVAANVGSGPDIVLAWLDDPQQYPDKLVELTDISDYLGQKYGGWYEVPARYGRTPDGKVVALPIGSGGGCIVYRKSWLNEAGFDEFPGDLDGLLEVAKGLNAKGHPAGLALGNAVGDGNTWHWVMWAFGGAMVDEENNVIIDSPETVAALEYAKELYSTFIPGTLSWLDPNNNKAYLAGDIGLTHNGISIYYAAINSDDPAVKQIGEDTYHARPPQGPIGRPTETSLIVSPMVFSYTEYPNAAKAYLVHMFEQEQYGAWQEACTGYWQHTLKAYDAMPFWEQDPKLTPFRDIAKNMLWYGYKGEMGPASSAVLADYVVVNMFANVCSGEQSPKEAAADAQRRAERYYS
jgi:multiple sugar transport system substrate-binding protein